MQQSKKKSKDVRLFRQPASQPMHASVIFMCALHNFVPKEKKRPPSRGYHQQQQNKLLCQFPARELALKSTLETSPRIGILDSELPTSKVERSAVICVVGHGYPATVGVCIREESAWIQALVVHERLAMASRVRLVEAGTALLCGPRGLDGATPSLAPAA
jgi:hypothetical protein